LTELKNPTLLKLAKLNILSQARTR